MGGLDAVLASLPEELDALRRKRTERTRAGLPPRTSPRASPPPARRSTRATRSSTSAPPRCRSWRGSCAGAFERMGEEPPEGIDGAATAALPAIELALVTLSRWLEEELEELAAEVGQRIGMEVDTDQNVHPFEVAFTLGAGMRIEALPGMELPEEPETFLGSFWRETAVARDELQWFATGHKLVEALVGLVRDGDAGRSAALKREWAPRRGGLYVRFEPRLATAADVAPGARVASRQASRYLDLSPDRGPRRPRGGEPPPSRRRAAARGRDRGRRRTPGSARAPARSSRRRAPPPSARPGEILARRKRGGGERCSSRTPMPRRTRLIEAAFQGGAPRERIEGCARRSCASTARWSPSRFERVRSSMLDAAAVIVP